MKSWPVQDAKARFSELLESCLRDGPQLVTKRGKSAAVLVPSDEWHRLTSAERPTRKQVLLDLGPKGDLPLPPRGRLRRRPPPDLS